MKIKLFFLALLLSMCSNTVEEVTKLKIISLSTTHTEIIKSIGAANTLVGIDSFSEVSFPVEVIDSYTVTADELKALDPDLVILAFDFNGIVEGLENQEINYLLLPPARTLEDVYSQIETIGAIVNKKNEAVAKTRDMKLSINRIIDNSNFEDISVYHEIGYSYGIYSVNSNSLIGEIYNLLGVENIANSKVDTFGSGYPELTEESILKANPDYIVVGHTDYLNKDLSLRPGWENMKAIEHSNIVFLNENLANNWGTTTVELVETLSNSFKESIQTNPYSNYFLLISLMFLVTMIFLLTKPSIKEKV